VIGRFHRMHQLVLDGQLTQLRLEVLRDSALKRGLVDRAADWRALPGLADITREALTRVFGPERLDKARQALGLPLGVDRGTLRSQLSPGTAHASVPVVYRRLFSDQAIEGSDLLAGRQEALAAVRAVLVDPSLRLRSAAVVSVDDHAARALVNSALRAQGGSVVRLQADHPWSSDDVESFLQGLPSRDVCIVIESIGWLFERTPGGTAALERVARAMVADAGKRAWLLLVDPVMWSWLTQATSLGDGVGAVVELGPLSPHALREAVLARHTMSGFEATFGDDSDLPLLSRLLRPRDVAQRRQREWFDNLHDASAGVLQDALRLWMLAIEAVDESKGTLRLGPVARPPVAELTSLSDPTMLMLLQVLRQGWIDPYQASWLFQVPAATAEAQLAQLVHQGLLFEEGPRFFVAAHLRGPLDRALRQRGWTA